MSSSSSSTGSTDCPCIDSSQYIASTGANCNVHGNSTTTNGFWHYPLTTAFTGLGGSTGACYPVEYGSDVCAPHDKTADPLCLGDNPPAYCEEQWCFVDAEACNLSEDLYYQAVNMPASSKQLFYSYSTCGSSNQAWEDFVTLDQLKGRNLSIVFPDVLNPHHYKPSNVSDRGAQFYFDDSVPWRGWVVDYLNAVLATSNIGSFEYTHRSVASTQLSKSRYTAAIHDIPSGRADVVASSLWITSERLAIAPFTTQVAVDRMYLWSPAPSLVEAHYFSKVLTPFSGWLWLCLLVAICIVSFLSLWFATPMSTHRPWWKELRSAKYEQRGRAWRFFLNLRVLFDAWLHHSTAFFSQSVEYDIRASFPMKILNFGFGFLILIAVAAYTANLAAFLTVAGVSTYIDTMDRAIEQGVTLCAQTPLQLDLEQVWPQASFLYFSETFAQMLEHYKAGRCGAMVLSEWDVRQSQSTVDAFCDLGIIRTMSIALEVPLGFAVKPQFAAGLSYWMQEAAKNNGTSFASFEAATRPPLKCSLDVPTVQVDELAQLTPANFALPLILFLASAMAAIVIQVVQTRREARKLKKLEAQYDEEEGEVVIGTTTAPETSHRDSTAASTVDSGKERAPGDTAATTTSSPSTGRSDPYISPSSPRKKKKRFSTGLQRPSIPRLSSTVLDVPTLPEDMDNLQLLLDMMGDLQADHERLQADQREFFARMERGTGEVKKDN